MTSTPRRSPLATIAARDAVIFRRIIAAQERVARADHAAGEAGDSWLSIGMALGVTKPGCPTALRCVNRPPDRR